MYVKGQSGNPGGKPKGAKNSFTKELKSAILAVYHKKGGVKGLLVWANTNPTDFYKELLKLLPREIDVGFPEKKSIKLEMSINDGKNVNVGNNS